MKKKKHQLVFMGIILCCIIISVIYGKLHYQNTSSKRPKSKNTVQIARIKSTVDKDNDGIDD